ncbi:hypothetical protein ZIOFF_052805 [Zingiber officinale]|uniref:Uncharacterized protein n=1 Tax=Zingiber officinale TaxID=94328 RepID=A0A8J5G4K7_ZINOF|nr:hypothetical protein ZIOFF_052805 [Zingiber officinale]
MWTAAVVGAVAVYWFVWVMSSAEVKGKRAVNLKMGSIMRDKVQEYWVRRPATPSFSGGLSGASSPPAYLPFLMQDKAAAEDDEKETFSKKSCHCEAEMPLTDSEEDSFLFPVKEIVQYPLPGYVAPSSISFSPDGRLISYLFSPDGILHRKVFAFDVASRRQELVICPPDGGGLDESNLSAEEKLRRERSRERGLGVTRYEWKSRSTSSSCSAPGKPTIMVPLPNGEISGLEPELKLTCCASSPIIDPHLPPDGSMLAYVRDDELHVLNPSGGEPKQLTFGAIANRKLPSRKLNNRWSLEPVGILMYTTAPPQAVWGVSEQQDNKKVEATIKEYQLEI